MLHSVDLEQFPVTLLSMHSVAFLVDSSAASSTLTYIFVYISTHIYVYIYTHIYIHIYVFFLGYLYAVIRINVVECFLITPVVFGPSNASPG